jgi:hypothetical protein
MKGVFFYNNHELGILFVFEHLDFLKWKVELK